MHPDLKNLIDLQTLDLRLAELHARIAAFPGQLEEVEASLARARDAVARAKESVTTAARERKKYELDVDDWKGRVRKYKDQIYEVKTNEAYKALQHEITTAEAQVADAEDRLLEQMVASEDFDRQVKEATKALAEAERAAAAERQKIEAERSKLEKEAAELAAQQQQLVAEIPNDLVDHYQRIARRHNGVALAPVRDETCTLCRVRVRPHVYQLLRQPGCTEIFHCETCTRILYYSEEPGATAPAASASAAGIGPPG
jgi:uncharacterized protein